MSKEVDHLDFAKDSPRRPNQARRRSSLAGGPEKGGAAEREKGAGPHAHHHHHSPGLASAATSEFGTEDGLPPPAVAFIPPNVTSQLKVRWAKIRRRIGNGSAPSESLGDPTATTESDGGSSFGNGARRNGMGAPGGDKKDDDDEEVDEVVVEQTTEYDCWKKTTIPSHSNSARGAGGTGTTPGTGTGPIGTMPSDASSLRQTAYESNGPFDAMVGFARYRIWPIVSRFFSPTYHDAAVEEAFQKEQWYNNKSLHIFGAFYLTLNWILTVALFPRPLTTWNKVQLFGLGPALSVPLVVLAAFDVPRRQTWVWQLIVFASIWITGHANPISMYQCGYYSPGPDTCNGKDFMATLFYVAAAPVVALFAMGLKRILALVYFLSWLVLVAIVILPDRPSYIRNVVNLLIFDAFILFFHYMREMADRRMYTMRAELKISFKAKQRAQINERKMMDAKRRFSSYIFHEVRVPLNTALLAVQNIKGTGNQFDEHSEHAIEFAALQGSLEMMSQVLNDVLDFSRMERGGFSSVSRPFSLHNVMRSIFVPLRLDAAARGLALETSLDTRVDRLALQAAFPDEVIEDAREGEGRVMGDEMRLRQIIGNLVSNACKFTKAGGKVSIKTELIYPLQDYHTPQHLPSAAELVNGVDSSMSSDETEVNYSPRLSAGRLQALEASTSPQPKEVAVVRFEITDSGVGIRKADMAENRLFSPYVQTAVGREQGGKGTGLGLSLVRQIVMLSGGRLGVRSKVGVGSTFFIELPFAIGPVTREAGEELSHSHRRTETLGGVTMAEKEKDGSVSPVSPMTDSSAASDYRFLASLRKRSSDPTLVSIDENQDAQGRPRDSSVSTQLSVPTAYRFSPPVSPALGSEPTSPALYISGPTPPNSASPSQLATSSSPTYPPSSSSSSLRALSPVSPPIFNDPFPLVPPSRPENRSHVSSASAPAEVTIPAHLTTSPVVSPSPTPPTAKPASGSTSTALELADGPLRVLVVDDDTLTRKLMSRMMQRLGCIVSTAENGKIALDMLLAPPPEGYVHEEEAEADDAATADAARLRGDDFDAAEKGLASALTNRGQKKKRKVGMDPRAGVDAYKHYDITFLDNQMPICSGVQVVAKLRSLGRDDLVVGVTANALLSDQEQYLESGASFILTKPVKEADLRKYLLVADKRRSESKDPVLRRQRQAMTILAGPRFPPPPSVHGNEEDDYAP
ncbi:hypothetical protein JCM11251_001070 [Rhodosporidiobolus azoricus]